MVKIKFFGIARVKFQVREVEIDAKSINAALVLLAEKFSVKTRDLKKFLIYVNEVNISNLKMYRTELKDGDVVMFLSPSSGG